jgi:transposase InsO family protein
VTLSVDASSNGLGAVLLQEGKPVAYASRALTSVQQQYAQIEKELLAIVYGCKKFHQYVYGREVEVETDHKPLQSIFKKPLHQAPSRLQKMLLQLQSYDLTVTYKSGKEMYLADTLSRSNLNESRETLVADLDVNMVNVAMSPEKCKEFQDATSRDPVLNCLKRHVLEGWPDDQIDCPLKIRSYWTFKEDISYQDGLLFKSDKVIVPKVLRSEMLSRIHESHLGINKCKQRARELLFWPGMSTQIEELVARCEMCATHRPMNSREPMIVSESPSRPWEMVGCDLFEFRGTYYLVCVDYYSKWPEIARLDNLSSKTTVTHLKSMFARYGIPDVVRSDNGPQFASQVFEDFQKSYGFKHLTSSPRFPQSNGEAERAVQTVKNLLKKAQDPYKALLDYRSTPLEGIGFSPSQLLMSRRLKTTLPVKKSLLLSENATQVKNALDKCKLTQKQNYDRRCSQELPPLKIGQKVRLQKDKVWVPATVVSKHETPRSYIIKDHSGSIYRRNRRHLREISQLIYQKNLMIFRSRSFRTTRILPSRS